MYGIPLHRADITFQTGNKINVFWAKKIKNVHVSAGTSIVNKGGVTSWLKKED